MIQKMLFLKILIAVLIVVVCGVFGLLVTKTWEPIWSPFRPNPEEVLAEMPKRMKEVKTFETEATLHLKFENERKSEISGEVKGDQDLTNLKKPKRSSEFEIKLITNGTQYTLAGETKTINKTSYFKLTKIPTIPFLGMIMAFSRINLDKIKNQWVKMDLESLAKKMEIPSEELEKLKTELKEQEEARKKIFEKRLKEILKEKEFFKVEKELPDQKINGISTYYYIVSLDKEEIKKTLPEILKVLPEQQLPLLGEPDWKEKILKKLDEFFEKINQIKGEIWIGKKDYLTRRVKFEKEIDLEKFESQGKLRIELKINLSKFNQKIKIEKPEKVKPMEEMFIEEKEMEELLEEKEEILGPVGKARRRARDLTRKADMRQILTAMEMYYTEYGAYFTSRTYPKAIGSYMPETPEDPRDGVYGWISNIGNNQEFCAYADLETNGYFTATHAGNFEVTLPPKVIADCIP